MSGDDYAPAGIGQGGAIYLDAASATISGVMSFGVRGEWDELDACWRFQGYPMADRPAVVWDERGVPWAYARDWSPYSDSDPGDEQGGS